jgi:hypothetical protein
MLENSDESSSNLLFDKDRIPGRTLIWMVNPYTLRIEYNPTPAHLIGFILFFVVTVYLAFVKPELAIFPFFVVIFITAGLFSNNQIACEMDTHLGSISYFRGGWAGLHWGRQNLTCKVGDVDHFEMQQYARRYGAVFQVVMCVGSKRYPLSSANLGFAECQQYAELVRDFINPRLPICAVDNSAKYS